MVGLAPVTVAALEDYWTGAPWGPLFTTRTGARLDRATAFRMVRRLAAAAGIDQAGRVGLHSLRHTFVTSALEAGVPLHIVQDAARHADPRTTRRYDRARNNLDQHATYAVAAFLSRVGRR